MEALYLNRKIDTFLSEWKRDPVNRNPNRNLSPVKRNLNRNLSFIR